ncbi:MAG: ATP-sensitive inward rectifier potassium channel 10 [Rhizomicrobium sp.]|jgi:inward rectifier potassium channel
MTTPDNRHSTSYRYITPGKVRRPVIKGQDGSQWLDFYHTVLVTSWPVFFVALAVYFIFVNSLFALLYSIDPRGVTNATNFWDRLLFSIQTLTSASYTEFLPKSAFVYIVTASEAFLGIVNLALITGIVFARFSRPFARVVFSRVAVITPFDGVPTLMFRAANQRANLIFDAAVTVSLARQVTTKEGHVIRRFQELALLRNRTPLFSLSWTVMHRIDETSPLFGLDHEALFDMEAEILIMLSGTDETLADVIYTRHSYTPNEILPGRRFVDVVTVLDTGQRMVDLNRFHDTEPYAPALTDDIRSVSLQTPET